MEPFDLKKAKLGYPVCTRSGKKVRIICFDYCSGHDKPIVGIVNGSFYEILCCFGKDGANISHEEESEYDLFMDSNRTNETVEKEIFKSQLRELKTMFTELAIDMCSTLITSLKDRCDEINKKAEEYKKLYNNEQNV